MFQSCNQPWCRANKRHMKRGLFSERREREREVERGGERERESQSELRSSSSGWRSCADPSVLIRLWLSGFVFFFPTRFGELSKDARL